MIIVKSKELRYDNHLIREWQTSLRFLFLLGCKGTMIIIVEQYLKFGKKCIHYF